MAYVIRSAGQYGGTLSAVGQPVGRHTYPTIEAAVHELSLVAGRRDGLAWLECGSGEVLVYYDEEDRDRDQDGSRALATIEAQS